MARPLAVGLLCTVLLAASTGCGGEEGGDGSRPSLTPTISPTRTLETPTPTRTAPSPTRTASRPSRPSEKPSEATPLPTAPASEEEPPTPSDSTRPTTSPSPDEETTEPVPTESPSATESAAGEDQPTEADPDDGVPAWVWWLLVAAVLAAGLAWFLVARARRRAWEQQLTASEAEVAWLARDLLPQLRSTGSVDEVAGGWLVVAPRVTTAEDQLTVLEDKAPDEASGVRARALRDAVRDARSEVEAATSGDAREMWTERIDQAIATLEGALAPPDLSDPHGR